MAGTFIIGEKKIRPGVYQRRYKTGSVVAGARNGIGLGLIRANWGPLNTVVDFTPDTNVSRIFGSGNTEGLITEMFTGGLTSGHFVRVGTGGTEPTINLQDDAGVDVVKITGAYVGDRAFTISIRDSLTGAGRECIFYEGTTEFCKISFAGGENEPDALIAAMKESTTDFIATKIAGGSGIMGECTQTAMTPGTQPTASTVEYSTGLEALYSVFGNCLCVDTDDVAVHLLVQPDWTFQGVVYGRNGSTQRMNYRGVVPDGNIDLQNVSIGDIIKRAWNMAVNDPPELQSLLQ